MKSGSSKTIYYFTMLTLVLCFSCTPEEDACFETVCYGPDGTDCVEEPKLDVSGCFAPAPAPGF